MSSVLARAGSKAMATIANATRFEYGEARRFAPTVRPVAVGLSAALLALMLAACAVWLCWMQMTADLRGRLKLTDTALSATLQEIDRDLRDIGGINVAADALVCAEPLREVLTRGAINSLLIREFFIQAHGASQACGSFGAVSPYWTIPKNDSADTSPLHVIAAQSIRATIVVARRDPMHSVIAVVEPRQLLDRLPSGQSMQQLRLLTTNGQVLAVQGLKQEEQGAFVSLRQPIKGWPLEIELSVDRSSLFTAVTAQLPFWAMVWVLLLGLSVGLGNALANRHSSRALRLQRALRKRRFSPVVQPIVDADTGECLGAEVLMRWKHPARGLVPPAEFIDYAERSGLIVPMSDLLMRQAHRQLSELALAYPALYFSFNITPAQLRTPGFSATLLEIFDGEPLGPSRVLLELTERDLVDEQVRAEMTRLRAFGFRIAIDDFGTGQSSLAVLQDLPIDRLKIDRAFINTISNEADNQPVLDAIIALAKRLKMSMVAEGIETVLQHEYLKASGVQALQGYLFGRPMIPADFRTWLDAKSAKAQGLTDTVGFNPLTIDLALVMDDLEFARASLLKLRTHNLRRYRNCLLGNELISWLSKRYDCSRAQGLRLGQRLAARGLVVHVVEEHDLEDAPYFYQLVPHQAIAETLRPGPASSSNPQQWLAWLQGAQGVTPGVRCAGLLRFRNVVSGSELVDALARSGGLSRDAAIAAGVQLMRTGHLRHVFDEHGFSDSGKQHYHFAR
jgi:EAL domain-containing protein (putative c-di-GMP-specific phosphodiesterase class I)